MKTITYEYDKMLIVGRLLNSITVSGTSNIRALAQLADIIDSGTIGETFEKEGTQNAVHPKTIQQNKLAK